MDLANREIWLFVGFTIIVAIMLYIDLFLVNRKAHVISIKSALAWSAVWISIALAFALLIYWQLGSQSATEYLTAYILEKSLSVDNLFVFLVIFSYFGIHPHYQPRVLRWGILGAIVLRAILIVVGVELVQLFDWMLYVFGALLIFTAYRLIHGVTDEVEPSKNAALRLVARYLPLTTQVESEAFLTRIAPVLYATPLLATLIVIETTDIVFALDSIPAVLGVSRDLLIVYTSNIFAILGLRALYFALAGAMQLFHYLKYSLTIILAFIGVRMLLHDLIQIPTEIALGFVFALLTLAITASLLFPRIDETETQIEILEIESSRIQSQRHL